MENMKEDEKGLKEGKKIFLDSAKVSIWVR